MFPYVGATDNVHVTAEGKGSRGNRQRCLWMKIYIYIYIYFNYVCFLEGCDGNTVLYIYIHIL